MGVTSLSGYTLWPKILSGFYPVLELLQVRESIRDTVLTDNKRSCQQMIITAVQQSVTLLCGN